MQTRWPALLVYLLAPAAVTSKASSIAAFKDNCIRCDQAFSRRNERVCYGNGKALRRRYAETGRADGQQHGRSRTLRQPRHLHAAEEDRSSNQRAGVRATAEEIVFL